jgi:hypothetical protein
MEGAVMTNVGCWNYREALKEIACANEENATCLS